MEEESRLIKLMANFPACDLREVYFKRWKEIFSEAIESEKELTALRSWKAKATPFLEFVRVDYQCNSKKIEDSLSTEKDKAFYRERNEQAIKTLTELLGGSDDTTKTS